MKIDLEQCLRRIEGVEKVSIKEEEIEREGEINIETSEEIGRIETEIFVRIVEALTGTKPYLKDHRFSSTWWVASVKN